MKLITGGQWNIFEIHSHSSKPSGVTPQSTGGLYKNAPITSAYGYRTNPATGQKGEFHKGVDLALSKGSPVYAVAGGEVIQSLLDGTGGEMIVVKTANGEVMRYLHMDNGSRRYKTGDKIGTGALIGRVGSTGQSTGPHLHFDVSVGGRYVDPRKWLG